MGALVDCAMWNKFRDNGDRVQKGGEGVQGGTEGEGGVFRGTKRNYGGYSLI